jgi:hypothetical protein
VPYSCLESPYGSLAGGLVSPVNLAIAPTASSLTASTA